MIEVTPIITYDCGCGFRTDQWTIAAAHARNTTHSLTIHGRILAEKPGDRRRVEERDEPA